MIYNKGKKNKNKILKSCFDCENLTEVDEKMYLNNRREYYESYQCKLNKIIMSILYFERENFPIECSLPEILIPIYKQEEMNV